MSNEKTRILCVITQSEMGGAQQFLAQLLSHINRDRFEPIILVGQDGYNQIRPLIPNDIRYLVAKHLQRKANALEDIRSVIELRRIYRQVSPDIIFLNSSKAGFNGSLAANWPTKLNARIVYRIGGWTFNDPWPAWKKKFFLILEKISAKWKDTIVVNNSHDFDQTKLLSIIPRKSVVRIYNGIDPYGEFMTQEEARVALSDRLLHSADKPYDWLVGTIANFYPTKDLPTLIEAASKVPENVRFVVIGDGPQRPVLEKLIIENKLEDRFFLVGHLANAAAYLPAFDVFALSSIKEGFPWSVLEAMTAKVPVIATRVGAIPEMLDDHISGIIVQPSKPEQLAQGILELVDNERLRQDLAIQAHQKVIAKFSLREMISVYEKIFLS